MTLVSRRFRRCYLAANKLGLKQVMKKRMIGQGELNMLEAVVILCSKYQNQRLHYEAGAPPGCMAHLLRQCMTMKTSFTMCGIYGIRHVNGNKFRQGRCRNFFPSMYGKLLTV